MAGTPVSKGKIERFEETVLPHLDAAFNLARWLTRNEHDAEDVVQESYLRAFSAFQTFQFGRDGRAWLLKIVRNTCYTWLRKNRPYEVSKHFEESDPDASVTPSNPETLLASKVDTQVLHQALNDMPAEYREILILREFEELSYKEIAQMIEVPVGTVMSRLSRARKELQHRCAKVREITQ